MLDLLNFRRNGFVGYVVYYIENDIPNTIKEGFKLNSENLSLILWNILAELYENNKFYDDSGIFELYNFTVTKENMLLETNFCKFYNKYSKLMSKDSSIFRKTYNINYIIMNALIDVKYKRNVYNLPKYIKRVKNKDNNTIKLDYNDLKYMIEINKMKYLVQNENSKKIYTDLCFIPRFFNSTYYHYETLENNIKIDVNKLSLKELSDSEDSYYSWISLITSEKNNSD